MGHGAETRDFGSPWGRTPALGWFTPWGRLGTLGADRFSVESQLIEGFSCPLRADAVLVR